MLINQSSDHLALLNIYQAFESTSAQNRM